jgi:hypothetical protein
LTEDINLRDNMADKPAILAKVFCLEELEQIEARSSRSPAGSLPGSSKIDQTSITTIPEPLSENLIGSSVGFFAGSLLGSSVGSSLGFRFVLFDIRVSLGSSETHCRGRTSVPIVVK